MKDAQAALAMDNEPLVQQYIISEPKYNLVQMKKMLKEVVLNDYDKYGYGRLAIELKGSREFIGYAGLKYIKELQAIDLEVRLKSAFWGNGYALEASFHCLKDGFTRLNISKIVAKVSPENKNSIAILENLGMKYVSIIDFQDQPFYLYSITKNEWLKLNRL